MIDLAGFEWGERTPVIVCEHVYEGSDVRTVQVDDDGLCFQCGRRDDDIAKAKIVCLAEVFERPELSDLPDIGINWVAHRAADGSWSIEEQPLDD